MKIIFGLLLLCMINIDLPAQPTAGNTDTTPTSWTAQLGPVPLPINPKKINILLAADAAQSRPIPQFGPFSNFNAKRFWLQQFKSGDTIAWQVNLQEAGSYKVDLLINCTTGDALTVEGPENSVVCKAADNGWQRFTANGLLLLPRGEQIIRMQWTGPGDSVECKSIELINDAEQVNIEKRIKAFKGDASWMKTAGYGIMTQVGGWAYPPHGDKLPWPGFADSFDVKSFVGKVRDMGGKFLVWSATWSDFLFPAPIQSIAEILPDRVSKRDLIGELISECQKYHIRFILYYHLGHDHSDVLLAKGWEDTPVQSSKARENWLNREMKILSEVGRRYGKGLDAVFLDDGCTWYPADFEALGAAVKAGNPQRLVCYNPWILPSLTPFQDYYCGEGFDGKKTPYPLRDGVVISGPQKGLQLFGNFVFDGPDWGIRAPDVKIDPPKNWSVQKIVDMTRRLETDRFSVAFNLLVYEDGSMNPDSYAMLKAAAQKLKRGRWIGSHTTHK